MTPTKARRLARREAAAHMRTLGYTMTEIAKDLGCSTATVSELLREADAAAQQTSVERDGK